jgi:hypothetical protein
MRYKSFFSKMGALFLELLNNKHAGDRTSYPPIAYKINTHLSDTPIWRYIALNLSNRCNDNNNKLHGIIINEKR